MLTAATLRSTVDELAGALGTDRLARILTTFHPEETRGLAAYHLARARAHPMAIEWHELMQAVEKSEAAGALLLPERSFFLLDILVHLRSILGVPDVERILRRIEVKDEYYSAMFEILILALYRGNGLKIEVVPETSRRTADFVIRTSTKDIYIECKSLEDNSKQEEKIWEQIESQIMKLLDTHRRPWRVRLTAMRRIDGRDIPKALEVAEHRIAEGDMRPANTDDQGIALSFDISPATPETLKADEIESMKQGGTLGWVEVDQTTDPSGFVFYQSRMIECYPYHDQNEVDRILDDLSDAHGQIPAGSCGAVHIEIPFRDSSRLLEVSDMAFQRLFGLLKQKKRLNAAILSARTIRKATKDKESAVHDVFTIVPNAAPAVELPETFSLLGAEIESAPFQKPSLKDTVKWIYRIATIALRHGVWEFPKNVTKTSQLSEIGIGREGTFIIHFGINKELSEQVGRNLVVVCSNDGGQQLRIWQSFKDHFRVDVVNVAFGRRTFRANLNHLAVGQTHKLAISWSAAGMSAAVNGDLLEQIVEN